MKIHSYDNVEVDLSTGHKRALRDIDQGENIIKYGFPIGHATCAIARGEWVHTHNLSTNLSAVDTYHYHPHLTSLPRPERIPTFSGYVRPDGQVGIRNDVWIVNTVGCVNQVAQILAQKTGAFAFPHPFGCSQLGDDAALTQKILRGMIRHPNAGGVLVLGLGCENNQIDAMKKILGDYDPCRVKFLNCQEQDDEIQEGIRLIQQLQAYAAGFSRQTVPVSRLHVGLKCGGSDGFSGISANPLVGTFSDRLIACGAGSVLTEVPEMFGAEEVLLERCENQEIYDKAVSMINGFKEYYIRHGQPVWENPSPGNKAGGITTLEEKSLGCVQKGGTATITDVLTYGDTVKKPGLSLLDGPGNDMVAVTNLMACGVQLILLPLAAAHRWALLCPPLKSHLTRRFSVGNGIGWILTQASCLMVLVWTRRQRPCLILSCR